MNRQIRAAALVLAVLAAAGASSAQPARLINARVEQRSGAGLEKAVRGAAQPGNPRWIGYAVPALDGRRHMCCYPSLRHLDTPCAGRCLLEEEGRGSNFISMDGKDCVPRDGGSDVYVLMRAESGRVDRIRAFSGDCELDAGGLPFVWLTDVDLAESVALLERYATDPEMQKKKRKRSGEPALSVIAAHGHAAADAALERFTAPPHPGELRMQAAFWLGNSRGRRGYEVLRRLARDEKDEDVRSHLTFALSQSSVPEAVPALIEMAGSDRSGEVRGQALFWLAQKAGEKAAGAIDTALEDDPDTEVKKKAVFALTQMPRDEGIPHLIRVAREHRNPEVRKQAIFWLGQSKDPRAFEFIRQVLEE
ncbi:MAG: HEAT repeat domain-containing protein [Thermoanaerobaculia bacterium]